MQKKASIFSSIIHSSKNAERREASHHFNTESLRLAQRDKDKIINPVQIIHLNVLKAYISRGYENTICAEEKEACIIAVNLCHGAKACRSNAGGYCHGAKACGSSTGRYCRRAKVCCITVRGCCCTAKTRRSRATPIESKNCPKKSSFGGFRRLNKEKIITYEYRKITF